MRSPAFYAHRILQSIQIFLSKKRPCISAKPFRITSASMHRCTQAFFSGIVAAGRPVVCIDTERPQTKHCPRPLIYHLQQRSVKKERHGYLRRKPVHKPDTRRPIFRAYRVYTAASVPFLPMNRYCLMINLCTMFHRFQLYRVDSPCNLIGFCCKCHW